MPLLNQSKRAKAIVLNLKNPVRIVEGLRQPAEAYGAWYRYLHSLAPPPLEAAFRLNLPQE
jgi:hypothetical protein